MKIYLVIRYSDELADYDFGVNDRYTLVGIFKSKEKAEQIAKEEQEKISKEGTVYREKISIEEVETDKKYEKEEEIFLGGGRYLE